MPKRVFMMARMCAMIAGFCAVMENFLCGVVCVVLSFAHPLSYFLW